MIEEKIEKWMLKSGKKILMILCGIIGVYFIFRFNIIGLFAPFIAAWIFAMLLNRIVTWGHKRLKIPRAIGSIISMLTILSSILMLIMTIIRKLWEQILNFSSRLPETTEEVVSQINHLQDKLGGILHLPESGNALINLDQIIEQVMDGFSSFLASIIPAAYDAVAKVPNIVLFIITMLLATFFMTKDYYKIKDFVKAQFSDTIVDKIVIMQRGILDAIGGYVRTQLILMSMTFSISLTGLLIFRVDYALLIAVIIAIIDALPVFGSGTILIPWAVYNLLTGSFTLGIGLLCIYGIIFVMRQILEPRILASQIGVYALVTLMSVYIGYRLIGFIGLILGPAVVVMLQMLQNVGALPKFKPVAEGVEGEHNEKYTEGNDQPGC